MRPPPAPGDPTNPAEGPTASDLIREKAWSLAVLAAQNPHRDGTFGDLGARDSCWQAIPENTGLLPCSCQVHSPEVLQLLQLLGRPLFLPPPPFPSPSGIILKSCPTAISSFWNKPWLNHLPRIVSKEGNHFSCWCHVCLGGICGCDLLKLELTCGHNSLEGVGVWRTHTRSV